MKKRVLSWALALCMVLALLPGAALAANAFTDVSSDAYYAAPVDWAVDKGITNGTSATTFSPDATCTRAQVVTFLWRSEGSPKPASAANPFADVKSDSYYYDAVLWAVEQNITKGTSATTFSPDGTCTRAQVVTFLHRTEGNPPAGGANPFADVPTGAYFTDAVLWAVAQNITKGTSNTAFSPNQPCTRAQVVTFLYRDAQNAAGLIYLRTKMTISSTYGSSVITWTYDEHGNNIQCLHHEVIVQKRTFNALGEVLSETWDDTYVTTYSYDEQGRVLSKTRRDIDDNFIYDTYKYFYDEQGNVQYYYADVFDTRYTVSFTYDEYGNVLTEVAGPDGGKVYTTVYEYTYDEQGRALKKVEKDNNGDIFSTSTYTYDANGNVLTETCKYSDGDIYTFTYEYQAFPISQLPAHWQPPMEVITYA